MTSLFDFLRARLMHLALMGVSLFLALVAAAYALRGLHILLSESVGALEASLIMSAFFLAIALCLGAFAFFKISRRRHEEARRAAFAKFVRQPVPLTVRRLRPVLRAAVGSAAVATGVAVARFGLRQFLQRRQI